MIALLAKCLAEKRLFNFMAFERRGARLGTAAFGMFFGALCMLDARAVPPTVHEDAVRSAGCVEAPLARSSGFAEVVRTSRDGNNRERTYLLHAPAAYVPTHPYSLVFVFHGAGESSRNSYGAGFQDVEGAADNAIFIFPDGIKYKNTIVGWDDADDGDGYDLPFFDHMLSEIEASYCIDTERVFAAGGSWGGDFVMALACHRGDKLRAVEVNSSGDEYSDNSNYMTYLGMPCPSKKRPAVLFEHAVGGDGAYPAPDFLTTSRLFKYLNSCGTGGQLVEPHTRVMSCVTYNSCTAKYTECFYDAAIGHARPPNLTRDTWNFFSGF
jgi:hypothetical protein